LHRPKEGINIIFLVKKLHYQFILIVIIVFISITPFSQAAESIGVAETIVGNVHKQRTTDTISAGDTLFYNQFVKTMDDSGATITFDDGTSLHIGPNSEMQLDDLVYRKQSKVLTGYLNLTKGIFQFANDHKVKMYVTLQTPTATIGIRGTKFAAYAKQSYSELAVTNGMINSVTKFGTHNVNKGQALKVTRSSLVKSNSISKEMKDLFDKASSLLKFDSGLDIFNVIDDVKIGKSQNDCRGKESTWLNNRELRKLIKGIDTGNLFFIKTKYGIIVIKANYGLARNLIPKIRKLIESEYYKRVPFFNVKLGTVAEAGDFFNSKPRKPTKKLLNFKRKTIIIKRGTVASNITDDEKLGNGRSFFIALRGLNLKNSTYKVWGTVVYGIQFADKLEVGSPPVSPDLILDMKTGSQLKEKCL
jgi:cyclophilin family peptidyl-prolyl cis-trans isomerase